MLIADLETELQVLRENEDKIKIYTSIVRIQNLQDANEATETSKLIHIWNIRCKHFAIWNFAVYDFCRMAISSHFFFFRYLRFERPFWIMFNLKCKIRCYQIYFEYITRCYFKFFKCFYIWWIECQWYFGSEGGVF